jgi:hypothetical protein
MPLSHWLSVSSLTWSRAKELVSRPGAPKCVFIFYQTSPKLEKIFALLNCFKSFDLLSLKEKQP